MSNHINRPNYSQAMGDPIEPPNIDSHRDDQNLQFAGINKFSENLSKRL